MMLGYTTGAQAKQMGFTHHGKYFGIPIWISGLESDAPTVMCKWYPMEFVMAAVHYIEGFLATVMYPDAEPAFQFLIGPEIGADNDDTD